MLIAEEIVVDGKVRSIHRHCNREFLKVIGYKLEETPDMETWYQVAYPDSAYRNEVTATFDQTVQERRVQGEHTIFDHI